MENYTNPANAQIIKITGDIRLDLAKETSLQVGDIIDSNAVLNLEKGSEIVLAYSDGTQHRVYSDANATLDEIRVANDNISQ